MRDPTKVSAPDLKALTVLLASTATPERGGLPYLDAVLPAEHRLAATRVVRDLGALPPDAILYLLAQPLLDIASDHLLRDRNLTARYEARFEVEDSHEWTVAMPEYNREADAITAALFRAQGEPGLPHLYLTNRRAFDRRLERGRQPLRAAERRARRPICGPRGSSTDPSPGCAKRSGRVVALLSRHPARRPGSCTRNPARVFSTPLRPLRGAGRAGFGRVHVFFSPPGSFSVHS